MLAATLSSTEYLQIIDYVRNFYETSWGHLVLFVTISFTVVAIIFPILFQWYQQSTFKIKEDAIKKHMQEQLLVQIEAMKKLVNANIEEKIKHENEALLKRFDDNERRISGAIGGLMHVQGRINLESGKYLFAYRDFIKAAQEDIKAKADANLQNALDVITLDCLPKLTKKDLAELLVTSKVDINKLLEMLDKNNQNGKYSNFIFRLKATLQKIT